MAVPYIRGRTALSVRRHTQLLTGSRLSNRIKLLVRGYMWGHIGKARMTWEQKGRKKVGNRVTGES